MSRYSLDWAYAQGRPNLVGLFRLTPEDFQVDEDLGFELEGAGEHVFLQIQKRGDNTAWLARQIARLADVQPNDVGYAGLKDRHAVTRQWFSVYLPKAEEPDWSALESDSLKVLQVTRHRQKLRRGAHRANQFVIRLHQLSDIDGQPVEDLSEIHERLRQVAQSGVPNYFGEQRFGHNGNNLEEAHRLLVEGGRIRNRQKRGLMLSAARSYLFNQVLSARVESDSWRSPMPGECMILNGEAVASGPLWGRGRPLVSENCAEFEQQVLGEMAPWCDGLEHVGLSQERRSLVLMPQDLQWSLTDATLELAFSLPPGTFATAVLREICLLKEMSGPEDMV